MDVEMGSADHSFPLSVATKAKEVAGPSESSLGNIMCPSGHYLGNQRRKGAVFMVLKTDRRIVHL